MRSSALFIAVFLVAACQGPAGDSDTSDGAQATQAESRTNIYQAAVNRPERSEADLARDAGRRPAEILEFFAIRPGMQVLDLYSGGGYYTELLARVVGPEGHVSAHNNSAYLGFASAEIESRYADDRLTNVTAIAAENNELDVDANRFDAITMVLTYHDFYYVDPENGWPAIDGPKLLAELYEGLKPGGVVGLVDHYAPAGAPTETGGTTHRIDKAIVIAEMTAAGFVLEAESELLRNPQDDLEKNMFDPSVRGKTDRFVLRFRKPDL